jgi:HAE1 family hydrophobic/amphiphilic exporter-1
VRLGEALPLLAVRRPVTVWMLLLATLVVGGIAWWRIPVQLMPTGFDFPWIWVWMPYEDATPREIEQQIVRPAEDALETLPGVRHIEATARQDFAELSIEFDQAVDMDEAWAGLVDRLERARPELPDDFERWYVYKYNPEDDPILWAGVEIPDGAADPAWTIETHLVRALERVPGVARVEFHGAERARLYIDFDREAVARHQVSLYSVMERLRTDNFTLPSGNLRDAGRIVLVRSLATLGDRDSYARLPIGNGLVLEDVAEVELAQPLSASIHRVNGKKAGGIDVYKESGSNTIEVCRRLQSAIDDLEKDPRLAGYKVHRFFDQGDLIQESVDNLRDAALEGGALAVLVLLVFLKRWRATALIALGIPLSLLMTLAWQYFSGESMNILSMMGLMIAVGMVVDDSIVVVEAIHARRERGETPTQAALHGTSEVALAVVASTLTTVVVFLPLILMSDDARFSFTMGRLGIPVCVALMFSLLVALLFVPLATIGVAAEAPPPQSRWNIWLTDAYARLLRATLHHRSTAWVVLVVSMASMGWPMNHMKKSDQVQGGIVDFVVTMKFPASYTLKEIDAALKKVEAVVEGKREEWRVRALRARRWEGSRRGMVMAFMEKRKRGDITREEIVETLPDLLPEIPGVEIFTGWQRGEGGGNELLLSLTGDDSETLAELSEEVCRRIRAIPGVMSAEGELGGEDSADELHVEVDRERAARYGVSPMVLARSVAFGFRGVPLRPLQGDGREIPVQAGYRLEDRKDIRKLEDFAVFSGTSGSVPLGAVAELKHARGFGAIDRLDRKTTLGIRVQMKDEDTMAGYQRIAAALSGLELPRGYSWNPGRRFDDMEEQDRARQFALLMSVCFVFLLMGMLFESFWLPWSIVLSVPFALVGVYWMMYVTQTTMEMMAGIAIVVLVGVVVKNAIVLVDRVQQHRAEGMPREEAMVQAGRDRLRPILMTAGTTVLGLVPMALGRTGLVGIPYYPMGRALIGGMLASTLLTMVLVPLFYVLVDDLREVLMGLVARRKGKALPRVEAAEAGTAAPPGAPVLPGIVALAALMGLAAVPRVAVAQDGVTPAASSAAEDRLRRDIEAIEQLGSLGPEAVDLALAGAVQRTLRHNLGLQVRVKELEAARHRLQAAWAPWVPFLFGSGKFHPSRGERWFNQYKTWERTRGNDGNYSLGVTETLFSGTTLSAVWSQGSFNQWTDYDPEIRFENPLDPDRPIDVLVDNEFHTRWSAITLQLNQHLLEGISPNWQMRALHTAQVALDVADISQRQEMESAVAQSLRSYWDLVALRRNVEIERVSKRLAEEQRVVTQARIAAGELAPIELLKIDETVATHAAELLEAERAALEAEQSLRLLMGMDDLDATAGHPLRPVDACEATFPEHEREDSLRATLERNPSILLLKQELLGRKIGLRASRHELLPVLDLEASLSLNGAGFTVAESVEDIGGRRYPDANVGLEMRVPLPDVGALREVAARKLEVEAGLLSLQQAERQALAGVESALRSIASYEEQVRVSGVRVALAAKNAEAAEATYQAGRSTLREVLDAQASLREARQAELLATVQALKARVDLELLRGSLLESLGVEAR